MYAYNGSGISLGITGHRPDKLGGYHDTSNLSWLLKFHMEIFFLEKAPLRIVSGMALGTDQWAVEVALKLGIKVTALVPCLNQEAVWPREAQLRYRELLERIERSGGSVEYVTLTPYTPICMHRRNQEIVAQSSEILSVWDGTRGGTRDCIRLAKADGLQVTNLNPQTMRFETLNGEQE